MAGGPHFVAPKAQAPSPVRYSVEAKARTSKIAPASRPLNRPWPTIAR